MISKVYTYFLLLVISTASLAQTSPGSTGTKPVLLDQIVAIVNNDVILRSELIDYLQNVVRQLQQQRITPPPRNVLIKQSLDRMIMRTLQLQAAKRYGVRVGDERLNAAIKNIAKRNRMDLQQFRTALESQGINYEKFRENIRKEMIVAHLQQRNVINRIQVTPQEVTDFLSRQKNLQLGKQEFHFAHILISLPDAASPEKIQEKKAKAEEVLKKLQAGADFAQMAVSVSDGQNALKGGELPWMPAARIPTVFSKVLATMKPGEISPLIRSSSGFHILRLIGKRGEQRHMVKQTHVRHILIRFNPVVPKEQQKDRLQQIKKRIESGEDFALLAKSHSDDTLSAKKGGDLGWLNPGDTVPPFEKAYSGLPVGQISQVFESQYGWHILQVLGRREVDDTQRYLRNSAKKLIRAQKAEEALQVWQRQLRDEAYVEYRLHN